MLQMVYLHIGPLHAATVLIANVIRHISKKKCCRYRSISSITYK